MSDDPSVIATDAQAIALLAPFLVGWSLQILFTGAALSTFAAYLSTPNYQEHAGRLSKCITWFLVFTNLACTGLDMGALVRWGCVQDRSIAKLFSVMLPDAFGPLPTIVVSTIVQLTYLRRTSRMFKRRSFMWAFVALIGALIMTSVASALVFIYNMVIYATADVYLASQYALSQNLWLWSALSIDVTLSATLCWLLRTRVAGFNKTTDNQLYILMRLAVESASYTAFMALVGGILSAIVNPESIMMSGVPVVFWIPLPGLYTMSYFTSLTARDRLESERTATGVTRRIELPASLTSGVNLNSPSAPASRPTFARENRQDSYNKVNLCCCHASIRLSITCLFM